MSAKTALAPLISHISAASLHISKPTWWLESRFHFSFADWYDPSAKQSFGALRVVNDDLVKGNAGFGAHPHRDMEIFSYIVDGELTHADSMGNKESLGRGSVQYMSAGTGVRHSEMNDHPNTCRFLQVWIQPDARGHKPQYGSARLSLDDRHNRLLHLLGGTGPIPGWQDVHAPNSIKLHQDANVFVSECDEGKTLDVPLSAARQAYVVCIEGNLLVNDVKLGMRDAAEIVGGRNDATSLALKAGGGGAHFMLIELAQPL